MSKIETLWAEAKEYKVKSSANRAGKEAASKIPFATLTVRENPNASFSFILTTPSDFEEEPKEETKEKPEILRKSSASGPCALVWDIAEKMLKEGAKRKEVIAACVEEGVAYYTARTQYQKYTEALRESNQT